MRTVFIVVVKKLFIFQNVLLLISGDAFADIRFTSSFHWFFPRLHTGNFFQLYLKSLFRYIISAIWIDGASIYYCLFGDEKDLSDWVDLIERSASSKTPSKQDVKAFVWNNNCLSSLSLNLYLLRLKVEPLLFLFFSYTSERYLARLYSSAHVKGNFFFLVL